MKYRRRLWHSVAQDYNVIWEASDYTLILRSIIQEAEIDLGARVLDVATGTGIVCIEAAKRVGDYGMALGIDFSKPMLKQAVKKKKALSLHNINFVLADAYNLPFPDKCFDAVTSCFTFAFLSNPQEAADEMARVLKIGGKAACVEWEKPPLDFWAELRKKGGIRDFLESDLTEILHNSRFRRIHTKRIQVLHRRPYVSQELVKRSRLLAAKLMGLKENNAEWFFSKIREEYRKLPRKKKHSWLPMLCAGIRS